MTTRANHLRDDSRLEAPPRVSEAARVIAAVIPSLPSDEVADLGRLIQRLLTTMDHREKRYARLGLLVRIVSERTAEVPTVADYDDLREAGRDRGEGWPSHTALCNAYGGWVNAVRAAMRLVWEGSSAQTPHSNHHRKFELAYSREEAVEAFLDCRDVLVCWPSEYEYDDWRLLGRELARRAGKPAPRHPSTPVWKRLFGSWAEFEKAARREIE